jgi:small-conductance mechanosensitive channel
VKENKRSSLIVSELSLKFFKMFSIFTNINKKAFINAIIATLVVIAATIIGSVNLQNFDAALSIYFFGTICMTFGVVYHHSVWKQRPATQKYWKRT